MKTSLGYIYQGVASSGVQTRTRLVDLYISLPLRTLLVAVVFGGKSHVCGRYVALAACVRISLSACAAMRLTNILIVL